MTEPATPTTSPAAAGGAGERDLTDIALPSGWSLRWLPDQREWHFFDGSGSRVAAYCRLRITAERFANAMRSDEPSAHVVIEAGEPGPGSDFDWALTIAWPDGTETLEMVSDHAAKLLDYDVEESDGTKPPRPLTAAQQATLDLNNRQELRS